jgi:hypothetical protein
LDPKAGAPVVEFADTDLKTFPLDDLSAYGVSQLFGTVAFGIALDHKLLGKLAHLYSTSISVSGEYLWLTRVPETITEAKECLCQEDESISWTTG